jgi:hypothetical protein
MVGRCSRCVVVTVACHWRNMMSRALCVDYTKGCFSCRLIERFEVRPTAARLVLSSSSRVPVVVDDDEEEAKGAVAATWVGSRPHGNIIGGGGGGEELFSGLDHVVALPLQQTRSLR